MKEKVKKMVDKATADLNTGIDTDDVKMIASAIQFLNGTTQAYIGYLSLLKFDDEKVGTDAE